MVGLVSSGSSGEYRRTGLPHGDYTLRVIARDPARLQDRRVVIRNRVLVRGDDMFCVTGTQNQALTISGNNATVEFYSTGRVTSYKCVVDRREIIENCKSVTGCSSKLPYNSLPSFSVTLCIATVAHTSTLCLYLT